jgi:chromosome segregation ATPase
MYSLKQAAEAAGRGKPAILRAIQRGIISAQRNARNEWEIDPAELHRVYPPVSRNDAAGVQDERGATRQATEAMQRENALLREQIELLKDERQDLRRRLDNAEDARQKEAEAREQAAAELRRLTLMLTDQRQPEPKPEGALPAVATEGKGRLWEKLFGR